jgi:DNA-binding transcriptional MerR regulator
VTDPVDPVIAPEGDPKLDDKVLGQEAVNRIAATEHKRGAEEARRKIAEELGISLDDAKELIKKSRDHEDAQKSEAQRDKEAAARERTEAATQKAEAARELHFAKVERRLIAAGTPADDDTIDAARRLLDVEVGADQASIDADIERVKKRFPLFFEASDKPGPIDSGIRGNPPRPKAGGGADAFERGAARAKALQGG